MTNTGNWSRTEIAKLRELREAGVRPSDMHKHGLNRSLDAIESRIARSEGPAMDHERKTRKRAEAANSAFIDAMRRAHPEREKRLDSLGTVRIP